MSVLLALVLVGAACGASTVQKTEFGHYRALTADGHYATVTFDAPGRTATLGWTADARTTSQPATVSWSAGRIVLTLRSGLAIDGRLTGDNRFQLTYPQNADGAPGAGQPNRTLDFVLASVS